MPLCRYMYDLFLAAAMGIARSHGRRRLGGGRLRSSRKVACLPDDLFPRGRPNNSPTPRRELSRSHLSTAVSEAVALLTELLLSVQLQLWKRDASC